jgi:hypothetical protein
MKESNRRQITMKLFTVSSKRELDKVEQEWGDRHNEHSPGRVIKISRRDDDTLIIFTEKEVIFYLTRITIRRIGYPGVPEIFYGNYRSQN